MVPATNFITPLAHAAEANAAARKHTAPPGAELVVASSECRHAEVAHAVADRLSFMQVVTASCQEQVSRRPPAADQFLQLDRAAARPPR